MTASGLENPRGAADRVRPPAAGTTTLASRSSDLWWKDAVIYCLDVETYQDSNGDGIGDFHGLIQRLDYISSLGVNCLWLMPFYPTPSRDDGYDVIDYYGVDARLGTLGDFAELLRSARHRGIRVIADLVVNHTSIQHPWFQAARSSRESPYRDWYVWRDSIPEDGPEGEIFPGQQQGLWNWDEEAGQYYLHRFYEHQPDLNIAHAPVRDEIRRVVGYWLQLGVSGFRVDAVPFLLETDGIENVGDFSPHGWMRDLRAFVGRRSGEAMLMGEVNLEPKDVRRFFGDEDGDELHMCLNFNLNQALALALVRGRAEPLIRSLESLPALPDDAQWANFIRNHDEWSLDKLSDAERREVFEAFGPDESHQIFGRGLRRRLPTMLNGDAARLRMAYALMLSLPGSPVLFYGEEIGMAENLAIEGRMSVRAPMQWAADVNAGFSTAPRERLRRPIVPGDEWGPSAVNVADQLRDERSLLSWTQRLIRRRLATPEIGLGRCRPVPVADPAVLALRYDWAERSVLVLTNLGDAPARAELELGDEPSGTRLVDLLGGGALQTSGTAVRVALDRYSSRWLRLRRPGDLPLL